MLLSYISPEDATLLLLNHVCFPSDCWLVLDVCVSLCLCQVALCIKEIEAVRGRRSLSSVPLLFQRCIIAVLPRMIANGYDFPRKGGEREYK